MDALSDRLSAAFWDVPYAGSRLPGSPGVAARPGPAEGANCQVFAYEVLRHFGLAAPAVRSDQPWAGTQTTVRVPTARSLGLLLFNATGDAYGAHVGGLGGRGTGPAPVRGGRAPGGLGHGGVRRTGALPGPDRVQAGARHGAGRRPLNRQRARPRHAVVSGDARGGLARGRRRRVPSRVPVRPPPAGFSPARSGRGRPGRSPAPSLAAGHGRASGRSGASARPRTSPSSGHGTEGSDGGRPPRSAPAPPPVHGPGRTPPAHGSTWRGPRTAAPSSC